MSIALTENLSVDIAAICEDVREEVGKKISLIGVFSGDIQVAEFPATIRVAFYFSLRPSLPGEYAVRLRVTADEAPAALLEGHTTLKITAEEVVGNVIIPLGYLKFDNPTVFYVEMSAEADKWVQVLRKRIFLGPVSR